MRPRSFVAFATIAALGSSLGASSMGCGVEQKTNGEVCLKAEDCLSGYCFDQLCAAAPPVLDGEPPALPEASSEAAADVAADHKARPDASSDTSSDASRDTSSETRKDAGTTDAAEGGSPDGDTTKDAAGVG